MGLLRGFHICSLCGQDDRCFSLDGMLSTELTEPELRGKVGCLNCLRRDRFGFAHDTEVGFITEDGLENFGGLEDDSPRLFLVSGDGEAALSDTPLAPLPKPKVSEEAIAELRRTPGFATWQDFFWPVHHDDFMAFVGYADTKSQIRIIFECLHCGERTEIDDPD